MDISHSGAVGGPLWRAACLGGKVTQLSRTFAIYIIGIISRAAQRRAAADNSQQSCGENRQNGNNSNRLWFDFLSSQSIPGI